MAVLGLISCSGPRNEDGNGDETLIRSLVSHLGAEYSLAHNSATQGLINMGPAIVDQLRMEAQAHPEAAPYIDYIIAVIMANADAQVFFPYRRGYRWTYRTNTGEERTLTLGARSTVDSDGRELEGRILRGWDWEPTYLVPLEEGILLVAEQEESGLWKPPLPVLFYLRWEANPTAWHFDSRAGCILWRVEGRCEGCEVVHVPGGTYDCVRVINWLPFASDKPSDTFWLVRDVGIVKRVRIRDGKREEWELVRRGPWSQDR